jgi:predicted transcriptional regulator
MPRKPKDVTDAELAVLQILWEHGAMTIRHITEKVYPHDPETQYSTVKRLLARLEAKGYVLRDARGTAHVFVAKVDRDGLVGRRLEALADKLCEGSISPLLMHLARDERLTEKQRQILLSLIKDLRGRAES